MIRKQLYLEEAQERALKQRAKSLGISEAEVVRRALDDALSSKQVKKPRSHQAIEDFLERAERISAEHRTAAGYRFNRQELYEEDERFRRWDDEK
jgi:hypothetical protein